MEISFIILHESIKNILENKVLSPKFKVYLIFIGFFGLEY